MRLSLQAHHEWNTGPGRLWCTGDKQNMQAETSSTVGEDSQLSKAEFLRTEDEMEEFSHGDHSLYHSLHWDPIRMCVYTYLPF